MIKKIKAYVKGNLNIRKCNFNHRHAKENFEEEDVASYCNLLTTLLYNNTPNTCVVSSSLKRQVIFLKGHCSPCPFL